MPFMNVLLPDCSITALWPQCTLARALLCAQPLLRSLLFSKEQALRPMFKRNTCIKNLIPFYFSPSLKLLSNVYSNRFPFLLFFHIVAPWLIKSVYFSLTVHVGSFVTVSLKGTPPPPPQVLRLHLNYPRERMPRPSWTAFKQFEAHWHTNQHFCKRPHRSTSTWTETEQGKILLRSL